VAKSVCRGKGSPRPDFAVYAAAARRDRRPVRSAALARPYRRACAVHRVGVVRGDSFGLQQCANTGRSPTLGERASSTQRRHSPPTTERRKLTLSRRCGPRPRREKLGGKRTVMHLISVPPILLISFTSIRGAIILNYAPSVIASQTRLAQSSTLRPAVSIVR
jgi:hypothetical protein